MTNEPAITNKPTLGQEPSRHAPLAAIARMVEQSFESEARITYDPQQGLKEIMRRASVPTLCGSPGCGGQRDTNGHCDKCGGQMTSLTSASTSKQVGTELRRLRLARGLSLAEMAQLVPYSRSYLSKLETGARRITPDIARCFDAALDTDGVLAVVVAAVDGALAAHDESAGSEVCPYPGLAAFSAQETRWFVGRERETRALISRLDDQLATGGLLAVVAASGAGKSSLLAAGLVPALAQGRCPVRKPGQ
jgi:transcriptional regulator with XRE-family HTH domain